MSTSNGSDHKMNEDFREKPPAVEARRGLSRTRPRSEKSYPKSMLEPGNNCNILDSSSSEHLQDQEGSKRTDDLFSSDTDSVMLE